MDAVTRYVRLPTVRQHSLMTFALLLMGATHVLLGMPCAIVVGSVVRNRRNRHALD
jgi:hypothetical protein